MIFKNKNQKLGFFLFKSDFFDLNQISRFKLNFLTNVSHLLGISNSNIKKLVRHQALILFYYIKEVKN